LKILPRRAPQKFNTFSTFAMFAKFAKFAKFNSGPEHPILTHRHAARLESLSQRRLDSTSPSSYAQGRVPGALRAWRGGVGVRADR
jgi:hypothetical protein